MKEEPNIDETIHKIEQMLEDKRRIMHYALCACWHADGYSCFAEGAERTKRKRI